MDCGAILRAWAMVKLSQVHCTDAELWVDDQSHKNFMMKWQLRVFAGAEHELERR